jgi:hypothetical protein
MIKSAAIIKNKTLAPWRELRLQKRKLKKEQSIERKLNKVYYPSPIGAQVIEMPDEQIEVVEAVDDSPPTREEMLQQAEAIGMKVDKRWSDATLLKHIEESAWAIQNDNS